MESVCAGNRTEGSNPSLSAKNKGLVINPLFYLKALGLGKVATKWELSEMKPYGKPHLVDHNGDLSKQWYIYFRYWDENKQKLVKAKRSVLPDGSSPNRIKNKKERYKLMGMLCDTIELLLQRGWVPTQRIAVKNLVSDKKEEALSRKLNIVEAIDEVMRIKKAYLSPFGYRSFKSKILDFRKYLVRKNLESVAPEKINRRQITEYLRLVKESKGKNDNPATARNRNNYLTELNALFEKMIEEEMTGTNPCKGIGRLKETVNRHVAYSDKELKLIGEWMEVQEPYLKLFSLFIGYAFLRPSEILRLKVKDIREDKIFLSGGQAKTGYSEVIPIIDLLKPAVEVLLQGAPNKDHYLFSTLHRPGPQPIGGTQYFSKRFGRCKEELNDLHQLGFSENHTLYALRHTFIRNIYEHFLQTMTQTEAEFKTMMITTHKTIDALRKYIRDYRIHLPGDWSGAYSLDF